jgi:flagellar protein FliO/FliZ
MNPSDPMSLGAVLQIATALALVVGLIFAAAWAMKRFGRLPGAATDQLRLVGGIHLGQRERIVVVQAGEQRLVVGVTPGCIRTLHVMEAGEYQEGEAGGGQGGFLDKFNQELRKRMNS